MAPINKTIESDLITLKNLCEYEKLGGTTKMLWFYGLLSRYPLEYLLYSHETPFHSHYRKKAKETVIKKLNQKVDLFLASTLTNQEKIECIKNIINLLEV